MWPFGGKRKQRRERRMKARAWRRGYDAASSTKLGVPFVTTATPPDYEIECGLVQLRTKARDAYRNNDLVRNFVRLVQANVSGPRGVTLQSRVMRPGAQEPDFAARNAVEAAWRTWGKRRHTTATGLRSWWQLQRDVLQSCATDGEFMAVIEGAGAHGFRLKVLDPETCPVQYSEDLGNGRTIRQGIEFDGDGRPVRYWFTRNPQRMHGRWGYVAGYGTSATTDYEAIPASKILHVFLPDFAIQSRGVPWVTAGLYRLGMLHGYHEAELVAARIAASQMGWFTESNEGDAYEGDDPDSGELEIEAEPGVYRSLPRGVSVMPPDSSRPNTAFGDFVRENVRYLAAGLGVSYASLSGDYSQANYSSTRQALLVERELWSMLQTWFVEELVDPVFERWIERAYDAGALKIGPALLSGPLEAYTPREWQPRRWQWVDPAKEMTAHEKAIANGLRSRSEVIREMGRDPQDVWQEIAAENAILASLGIVVQTEGNGNTGPEATAEDDDE